jgi:trimethylamine--corrinoid protein Co-methyltransferase
MHIAGHPFKVLSNAEIELIHHSALRVLSEMGMEIQHQGLLADLAEYGLAVDFEGERVRFPTNLVESFLDEAPKYDWEAHTPRVTASAGIYHGLYHDPITNALVPWTEDRLAFYFALARELEHVGGASMLGCRIPVPAPLEPLYERYYNWKFGGHEGGSIYLDETCPYLYSLYQMRAEQENKPLEEVFSATVYLVPALKLGRHEAYQVQYFRERGLKVGIGDMHAMGGNAPVTFAGAVTLNWAERLALGIVNRVWFGVKRLHLGTSLSAMDMKTMIYPYGRPENAITNVMSAQIARRFGVSFSGHAGLSDAKLPSAESGAQKALTAIPTLMAGGSVWLDAGLLSIDEVFSPVQMVLDNELISAMKRFTHDFEISPESIGLATILEAGPGGGYLDKTHTAQHFRKELWQPEIWSREMVNPWLAGDQKLDADKARDRVLDFQEKATPFEGLSEGQDKDILALINQARKNLVV